MIPLSVLSLALVLAGAADAKTDPGVRATVSGFVRIGRGMRSISFAERLPRGVRHAAAGALVRVSGTDGVGGEARTDQRGFFVLDDIPLREGRANVILIESDQACGIEMGGLLTKLRPGSNRLIVKLTKLRRGTGPDAGGTATAP